MSLSLRRSRMSRSVRCSGGSEGDVLDGPGVSISSSFLGMCVLGSGLVFAVELL